MKPRMKPPTLLTFCIILLAHDSCKAHWDAAYFHNANDGFTSKQNWMSGIRDDAKLSEIAMPGTHDSGAYKNNIDIIVTQCLSFSEQLNYGIRVFDIRIRHLENSFMLHHSFVYLNLNFDDFLSAVDNFLKNFPSETVLFRLREEYTAQGNTRSLKETLMSYVNRYAKFLSTTDSNIKLSQARGRFIILANNGEFTDFGLNYNWLDIQDQYNLGSIWDLYGKWESVKAHLLKAAKGNKDTFYMNYLSGSGRTLPYFVASGHISSGTGASRLATGATTMFGDGPYADFPRVSCFFRICTILFEGTNVLTRYKIPNIVSSRTVGIIMADYPGESLISAIIANNRNLRK